MWEHSIFSNERLFLGIDGGHVKCLWKTSISMVRNASSAVPRVKWNRLLRCLINLNLEIKHISYPIRVNKHYLFNTIIIEIDYLQRSTFDIVILILKKHIDFQVPMHHPFRIGVHLISQFWTTYPLPHCLYPNPFWFEEWQGFVYLRKLIHQMVPDWEGPNLEAYWKWQHGAVGRCFNPCLLYFFCNLFTNISTILICFL